MSTRILILLAVLAFSTGGCRSNSNTCVVGASAACLCPGDHIGAQVCQASNTFSVCSCSSATTEPLGCVPGQSIACACSNGILGAQLCQADRSFASCACSGADAAAACVPGRAVACACPNGQMGAQVCQSTETFGSCTCISSNTPDASATDGGATEGGAVEGGLLTTQTVLDFPNDVPGGVEVHGQVNHGLFWADSVDLGTSFFWDAYVAPRTGGFLVSDGFGGAHAMLWGPVVSNGQMLFQGNIWNGQEAVSFTAVDGPAPGEWGYHAIAMAKDPNSDNAFIYNYWNGITVGVTRFGNLTRHTASPSMGNGILYVMGSTHQNLGGRLAALRVWDRSSPFSGTTAFIPERAFSAQRNDRTPVDFLADYTRPAVAIPDLSPIGYAGGGLGPPQRHPGRILNSSVAVTVFAPTAPNPGPLPTWVFDPRCPYGVGGPLPPNPDEKIPAPTPVPSKALVFDSFGRRAQNFLWQRVPTLGKTEGGMLGPLDWKTDIVGPTVTVPSPWGIVNGRAVFLENQAGLAWVDAGTADQDVRITRFPTATATGIAFRVQDRQNFWFAFVPAQLDPSIPAVAIHIGYFQGGTIHELASYPQPDNLWATLRVQAVGSTMTVFRDDVVVISLTNTVLQTATGAGMTGTTNPLAATSFWRGDNFTVCGATGC